MNVPIENLTPKQIVEALDKYIVGQNEAKKAVAVALRNRYRRQQLSEEDKADVLPKNILMIGPTGVGKTEIARRVAQLASAPLIKVEATKFTEVGYVGRDVESMIRDLISMAVRLVEKEKIDAVKHEAEKRALEKLVDLLDETLKPKSDQVEEEQQTPFDNPFVKQALELFGQKFEDNSDSDDDEDDEFEEQEDLVDEEEDEAEKETERLKRRKKLVKEILEGKHDDEEVEIEVEEQSNPFLQVFTPQGMEEMGIEGGGGNMSGPFNFSKKTARRATVKEALVILTELEAKKFIDQSSITREAVVRTEQTGIIFLDEIDKIAIQRGGSGPDVSREGVQRDLLPIIEGSTVATKFGSVKTDHILFIGAGAFHASKPSDLIPELQGRLPIRVNLEDLGEEDFKRILSEPKNALLKQYQKLLGVEKVKITFSACAIDELARYAQEVNEKTENIGARRLHTLLEKVLESLLFEAPEIEQKEITIDSDYIKSKLEKLVEDTDMSKFIL